MNGTTLVGSASARPLEAGETLLGIESLDVAFYTVRGVVRAVREVTLAIPARRATGIVGESGSGKSVTALAAMGLVAVPGRVDRGRITWRGEDVTHRSRLARLRGRAITMVFQDPMTSLNPVVTIGRQITEVLRKHKGMGRRESRRRATELLELVGMPSAAAQLDRYPHELSGGMRQRVMIAIALAPEPALMIADEPTTALDVTIQAQILELIRELQHELGLTLVLITHDLGVVAGICDHVAVMYAGRIVEEAPTDKLFTHPRHPYTAALLASTPRIDQPGKEVEPIPGTPPDPAVEVRGCPFAPRCGHATEASWEKRPELVTEGDRKVACWNAL